MFGVLFELHLRTAALIKLHLQDASSSKSISAIATKTYTGNRGLVTHGYFENFKNGAFPPPGGLQNIGICWPRRCHQMTAVHSRQPDLLHRPSPRATRSHEGNTHTTVRLLLLRATPMGLRGELSLVPRGLLLFGWGKQVEGGKVPKPCRNAPKPCKNAACPDFPPQHVSPPQPNIIRFELSSLPKKSIKYLRVTTRIEHLGGR